jgi:hypothetical protein
MGESEESGLPSPFHLVPINVTFINKNSESMMQWQPNLENLFCIQYNNQEMAAIYGAGLKKFLSSKQSYSYRDITPVTAP